MRRSLLLALALSGCAAPIAGTATTPVTVDLRNAWFSGSSVVTLTVTVTPTSEAKQDAKADGNLQVPLK